MKEKALKLLKRKVYLADICDELTPSEEAELPMIEKEFEEIKAKLSEDEKNWLYAGFAGWYEKFMDMETKMFIKPRGG
ncbi:MAG: hypothetical protein C0602_04735 [Denitrovibrio sp.]|nr:MAG: hypothetical protein C0602_04735 [Denitrovibrio sp.]